MDKPAEDWKETDTEITISKARYSICTESAAEVMELARALRSPDGQLKNIDPYVVRGLSIRIQQLAEITLGALEEKAERIDELSYRLRYSEEG